MVDELRKEFKLDILIPNRDQTILKLIKRTENKVVNYGVFRAKKILNKHIVDQNGNLISKVDNVHKINVLL